MKQTIITSFYSNESASKAVGALLDHGVDPRDISVLAKDMPAEWKRDIENQAEKGITTTTSADVMAGAAKGAGIGLGIGVLAALAAVTIPGFGIILGGGALGAAVGTTAVATAAGSVAGGAYGYLVDQGADEDSARYLSNRLESGGVVVNVSVPSNGVTGDTVHSILVKYTEQQDRHAREEEADKDVPDSDVYKPNIYITPPVQR